MSLYMVAKIVFWIIAADAVLAGVLLVTLLAQNWRQR